MLEMKPRCENCEADLPTSAHAYICIFECTFFQACTDKFNASCPNCSGELVRRPKRKQDNDAKLN